MLLFEVVFVRRDLDTQGDTWKISAAAIACATASVFYLGYDGGVDNEIIYLETMFFFFFLLFSQTSNLPNSGLCGCHRPRHCRHHALQPFAVSFFSFFDLDFLGVFNTILLTTLFVIIPAPLAKSFGLPRSLRSTLVNCVF